MLGGPRARQRAADLGANPLGVELDGFKDRTPLIVVRVGSCRVGCAQRRRVVAVVAVGGAGGGIAAGLARVLAREVQSVSCEQFEKLKFRLRLGLK